MQAASAGSYLRGDILCPRITYTRTNICIHCTHANAHTHTHTHTRSIRSMLWTYPCLHIHVCTYTYSQPIAAGGGLRELRVGRLLPGVRHGRERVLPVRIPDFAEFLLYIYVGVRVQWVCVPLHVIVVFAFSLASVIRRFHCSPFVHITPSCTYTQTGFCSTPNPSTHTHTHTHTCARPLL